MILKLFDQIVRPINRPFWTGPATFTQDRILYGIPTLYEFYSRNEAYKKLSPKAPPQRVIHLPMLVSLILQILLMTVVQTLMYEWTINQEWFCSISDNFPDCFERNDEGGILRRVSF